jgi:hypothetical protein
MGCFDTVYIRCPNCGEVNDEQIKHGPCSLEKWNGKTVPRDVAIPMTKGPQSCECGEKFSLVWIEPTGPLLCVRDEHFAEIPEDEED